MSYNVFAQYYDLFTSNVDYKAYAKKIDKIVTSLGIKRGSLVDLGCGTASLSLELADLGYRVTGIDISQDMLVAASNKVHSSGKDVTLVKQDMTKFSLPERSDVIISTLDGINHLDGMTSVKRMFAQVKRHLTRDGVFIFDMNTLYKHKNVLGSNCFIFDSDRAYLGWQNDYMGNGRVDITLDFFVPCKDGSFSRYTEEFSEKAYPVCDILSALADCELKVVGMWDGESNTKPKKETQRILFAVKHNV